MDMDHVFSTDGKPDAVKIAKIAQMQAERSFTAMNPATEEQMADKLAFFTRMYEGAALDEIEGNRRRQAERDAPQPLPNVTIPKGMTLEKAQKHWDDWNNTWTWYWGGMKQDRHKQMAKACEHRSYWSNVMTVLRHREAQQEAA